MTFRLPRFLAVPAMSLPLVGAATGCVVVDGTDPPPPYNPYGDIAFDWSFDGILTCDEAAVDELDIVVLQAGEVIDLIEREPCVGGGLVLSEYFEGLYEVEVDAFARDETLLYSGGFTARVNGGEITDAGLITLRGFGPQPPPPADFGDVALFWAFAYPADTGIIACDIAGVREVDVRLVGPPGEEPIAETFACAEHDGAIFEGLLEGRWTMEIEAFGTYANEDIRLYLADVDFTVTADRELDLDTIVLGRDEESFADFQIDWGFNGTSCAAEGIDDVQISFQRSGLDAPEEVLTVACDDLTKTVTTFVPGTYEIHIDAQGIDADWFSTAVVDLAPDSKAIVPLQLAPGT